MDGHRSPDDQEEPRKSGSGLYEMLNGSTAGAILLAVIFWTVLLLLPERKPDSVGWGVWIIVSVLAFVSILGFVLFAMSAHRPGGYGIALPGAMSLFGFCLFLGFLIIGANTGFITVTAILKFALAVGGTALASFVVGLLLFDTIRAAASVPIVVLFIGTATFPAPIPELAAVRPTLIAWMGIIIGASAIAEGANQVAGTIRASRVAQTVVQTASQHDLTTPGSLRAIVDEVARVEPGDLHEKGKVTDRPG